MISNLGSNAVAGLVLGVADAIGDIMYYGMPPIYDIFSGLGRFGRGVWKIALGFVLGFVGQRAPVLQSMMLPERMFVAGVADITRSAVSKAMGEGFAVITKDGQVKTEESDTITVIYKQVGGAVYGATTGSASDRWFSPVHYVVAGAKYVYKVVAPRELPTSGGGLA